MRFRPLLTFKSCRVASEDRFHCYHKCSILLIQISASIFHLVSQVCFCRVLGFMFVTSLLQYLILQVFSKVVVFLCYEVIINSLRYFSCWSLTYSTLFHVIVSKLSKRVQLNLVNQVMLVHPCKVSIQLGLLCCHPIPLWSLHIQVNLKFHQARLICWSGCYLDGI